MRDITAQLETTRTRLASPTNFRELYAWLFGFAKADSGRKVLRTSQISSFR